MSENSGSKVSFFLVGLGIGALVGILFAPKSGEETREFLSQKADEGRDYAQRKARELRERAEDILERSKTAAVAAEGNNFGGRRCGPRRLSAGKSQSTVIWARNSNGKLDAFFHRGHGCCGGSTGNCAHRAVRADAPHSRAR